jgi:hypothetical protein
MIKLSGLVNLKEAEDSVAEADMKKAKQMKRYLQKILTDIGKAVSDIEYNLSDFNSPGLKAAFMDGIKAGFKGTKFDSKSAVAKLLNYYKR